MMTTISISLRAPMSRVGLCALLLCGGAAVSGCDGSSDTGSGGTGGTGAAGGTGTTGGTGGTGGATSTGGTGGATSTGGAGGTGGGTGGGGAGGAGLCDPQCAANQGISSECVAIVDNAGKSQFGLRVAQLALQKPAALTSPLVGSILEDAVTINLPDCNLTGNGTFSLLLELDTAAGTLKTGGAKPVADPTAGYCFVNEPLGGTPVTPLVVDAAPDAGGTIDVAMGGDVVLPIFLGGVSDFILLPIRDLRYLQTVLSADQGCIGVYNANQLLPEDSCEPAGDVERFTNAGALDGHITLEDADTIIISALGQSLCVLLTGDPGDGGSPKKCARDPGTGMIIAKGDWCSPTNTPGGCMDAFQITGNFAASAVQINGDCP